MTTIRKIKRYGWRPDTPDARDHISPPNYAIQPPHVDLRPGCPAVYDQGDLGSCTANAIAAALEFERLKQKMTDLLPSRLFIYYNERVIEGTISEDAGAEIRDGIKSVAAQGAPDESAWPYDISKFAVQPPQSCYDEALKDRALQYLSVIRSVQQVKAVLAAGIPVVIGFTVYESFESTRVAQTGLMPMPSKNEMMLGGHAVLVVGYDDKTSRLIVRNSWGAGWGDKGYFYMPYQYIAHPGYASDFWRIQLVG